MIDKIESISYDYQTKQMIVNVDKPILHKGYMTKELKYPCSESAYIEKVSKWLKGKK